MVRQANKKAERTAASSVSTSISTSTSTSTSITGGQSSSREASWLLMNLRWLSLVVILVTGSIMLKQMAGSDHHAHHTAWLDLPQEVRDSTVKHNPNLRFAVTAATATAAIPVTDQCQDEYDRATSSFTPGLTMDDLERSRALVGNRHRLANLAKTLEAKARPVTAVVCGGSITLGHGLTVPSTTRYSDRLQVWLNDKYPLVGSGKKHEVFNRGAHGADICAMAKRVNVMLQDLTAEPDLFVLEFAVNDYQGQDHKIHVDHKTDVFFDGFEPLILCAEIVVHKLLTQYPKAAVMFLEFQTAILNRKTAALLHIGVAKHYQIPVISYAETMFPDFYRLTDQLKDHQYSTATISSGGSSATTTAAAAAAAVAMSGTADPVLPFPHGCVKCQDQYIAEGFRDKGCKSLCVFADRSGESGLDCKKSPPGREPCYVSFLSHDAVHPSAAGHQIASDLIAESIVRTGLNVCKGQDYPDHILPTVGMMVGDPKILNKKSNFVMVKDTMQVFAKQDPLNDHKHSAGFKLFGDSVDRPGWIATRSSGGESVEFMIDLPKKACYVVNIAILKSYEKMGTFSVTVTDLATNKETTTKLDGLWLPRISVPSDIQITSDEDPGCTGKCLVKVTTDKQVEGRSANKVKITTLSARECL